MAWSPDSQELYYVESAGSQIKKVSVAGGAPVTVRAEPVRNLIGVHGAIAYAVVESGGRTQGRPGVHLACDRFQMFAPTDTDLVLARTFADARSRTRWNTRFSLFSLPPAPLAPERWVRRVSSKH